MSWLEKLKLNRQYKWIELTELLLLYIGIFKIFKRHILEFTSRWGILILFPQHILLKMISRQIIPFSALSEHWAVPPTRPDCSWSSGRLTIALWKVLVQTCRDKGNSRESEVEHQYLVLWVMVYFLSQWIVFFNMRSFLRD